MDAIILTTIIICLCIQALLKMMSGAGTVIKRFSVVVDPSHEVRSDVWADFTINVPCSPQLYPELEPGSMGIFLGIVTSELPSFLKENLKSMEK